MLTRFAEREQQILVQLHPDRVVRVDAGRREPLVLALVDPLSARRAVAARYASKRATCPCRRAGRPGATRSSSGAQPVDHRPVVRGVAVVVGHAAGPHLPVVADPEQLDVERQEALVAARRPRLRPRCRSRRAPTARARSRPSGVMRIAARDRDDEAGLDDVVTCRRALGPSSISTSPRSRTSCRSSVRRSSDEHGARWYRVRFSGS